MPKLVKDKSRKEKTPRGKSPSRYEYSEEEKSDLKRLGEGIGILIRNEGKSAEKFAYELELGKGHLSRILRGQTNIRYCTLRTIAKGLGYNSVASLLQTILGEK